MLKRKTVVLALSNLIIVKDPKKVQLLSLYNLLFGKKLNLNKLKTIEKICKNPIEILSLKGNKKTNLLLFMMFDDIIAHEHNKRSINRNPKAKDQIIKTLKICRITKIQKLLFSLLKSCFERIRNGNFLTKGLFCSLTVNEIIGYNENLAEPQEPLYKNDSSIMHFNIETFPKAYESMIKCILENKTGGAMIYKNSFYPEIDIYNDFLLSAYEISTFNLNLLNRNFTTVNERGIRDFIKTKIEEEKNK